MNKILLLLLLLTATLAAWSQEITIIENEAEVRFIFLDDEVEGTLEGFQFDGVINLSDLSQTRFAGSVETATLDTDNWLRSRHLRSKKYFSAKDHPRISFNGIFISGDENNIMTSGELTMKGITKTVTFYFENRDNKLTGTASLNTQDFEIYIYAERDRNKVEIEIILPYTQ